jgi:hypothetical protein
VPINFISGPGSGDPIFNCGELNSPQLPRLSSRIILADLKIVQTEFGAQDKKENSTAGLIPDGPFFALRAPCAVAMSRNENISRGSSRTKSKSALAGNLSDEFGRV